jgi:hypothetical protein
MRGVFNDSVEEVELVRTDRLAECASFSSSITANLGRFTPLTISTGETGSKLSLNAGEFFDIAGIVQRPAPLVP